MSEKLRPTNNNQIAIFRLVKRNYLKQPLLIAATAVCLCLNATWVSAAKAEVLSEEEQPRWFEIEIIVFKPTSKQSLTDESWAKDTQHKPADNRIDFLQPYYYPGSNDAFISENSPEVHSDNLIEINDTADSSVASSTNSEVLIPLSPQNNQSGSQLKEQMDTPEPPAALLQLIPAPESSAELQNGADHTEEQQAEVEQEKPFQLLKPELLQLSNEATSLQRHPDYKVLTHLAWRQPVLNSKNAISVRISGGEDFSTEYDYQGSHRMDESETYADNSPSDDSVYEDKQALNQTEQTNADYDELPELPVTLQPDLSLKQIIDEGSDSQPEQQTENLFDSNEASDSNETSSIAQDLVSQLSPIEPMLWVPELDGDIKVYLNRYLHIRTNLILRRPVKEEIEVVDLEVFDQDSLSKVLVEDSDLSSLSQQGVSSQAEESFYQDLKSDTATSVVNTESVAGTETSGQQFSWEIDENFLQTESEVMYIERLFDYPFIQSSRVRSGELRYFDHPLLGVLVIIRPYELKTNAPIEDSEEQGQDNQINQAKNTKLRLGVKPGKG